MFIGRLLGKLRRRKEHEAKGTEERAFPKPAPEPDNGIGPDGFPIWWHKSMYACDNVISMPPEEAERMHGKEIYHPLLGWCVAYQHHVLKDAVTFMPKEWIDESTG